MGIFQPGNNHAFKKGHKKIPGSGGSHWRSKGIRDVLRQVLPEEEMKALWQYFLYGRMKDGRHVPIPKEIRFDAFKMAVHYLYGRPPREPIEAEDRPLTAGPQFDVSAVPTRHEPIN